MENTIYGDKKISGRKLRKYKMNEAPTIGTYIVEEDRIWSSISVQISENVDVKGR
jgi:hypothetical protein